MSTPTATSHQALPIATTVNQQQRPTTSHSQQPPTHPHAAAVGEELDEEGRVIPPWAVQEMRAARYMGPMGEDYTKYNADYPAVDMEAVTSVRLAMQPSTMPLYTLTLTRSPSLVLVVMMRSKEFKTSRSILMLILSMQPALLCRCSRCTSTVALSPCTVCTATAALNPQCAPRHLDTSTVE